MTWLTLEEAATHCRVSVTTLRERMRESDVAGLEASWLNVGGAGRRARWQFDGNEIDRWWRQVNEWRASRSGSATASLGTMSGGESPAQKAASSNERRATSGRKTPTSTSTKSRQTNHSDVRGRLASFAQTLTSRPG